MSSLDLQNEIARQHDYTYIETSAQVRRFAKAGYLVPVSASTPDYRLNGVGHPFARSEVALFIGRLGAQYRRACGERLVVTSLTRPTTRQPRNASPRSVHPTGMALDLRRSSDPACRSWLEKVLTDLEGEGVIEAVREQRPPHYHVAVFPLQYAAYVATLDKTAVPTRDAVATADPLVPLPDVEYRVRRGDSLWKIAQRHRTTVAQLRSANGLRSSRIYAGQVLTLPTGR